MIYTKGITKTVCAVLDEDIAQSIQQEARRERRSLSHQINHILRGYVAQQDMGKPDLRKLCAGKKCVAIVFISVIIIEKTIMGGII